jgi:hypothetical protein
MHHVCHACAGRITHCITAQAWGSRSVHIPSQVVQLCAALHHMANQTRWLKAQCFNMFQSNSITLLARTRFALHAS